MTAKQFRQLALSFPGVAEASHMNHPDFRVDGKIFATLAEDESWGMVKLSPTLQQKYVEEYPTIFVIFENSWGRLGCTKVFLKTAKREPVMAALKEAWELRQEKPKKATQRSRTRSKRTE
jgi:hypothetical protein